MIQLSEIKERFNRVEQRVEQAMSVCSRDTNVSPQLASCLQDLDREVHGAHDTVLQAQKEDNALFECIDHLEEMSDTAKQACLDASSIGRDTRDAVLGLHKELSTLKHQIH